MPPAQLARNSVFSSEFTRALFGKALGEIQALRETASNPNATVRNRNSSSRVPVPSLGACQAVLAIICPRMVVAVSQQLSEHEVRSEEHTSELQSLMSFGHAASCSTKKSR